ncbi:MAG: hypothetical protein ACP5HG_09350 [Anaerolineae bacterium]
MVWDVVRNGLWILGLAVLLATWSWARYAAYEDHVKTKEKLNEFTYALILDVGLALFIAGMALTEDRWWARLLWVALGLVVIVHAVLQTIESRRADAVG